LRLIYKSSVSFQVNVYLQGVPYLCYNSDPGEPSPRVKVELPPNSAETVTFPMIPLKNGLFPVKVVAAITEVGIPDVDIIEKKLFVVVSVVDKHLIELKRLCNFRKFNAGKSKALACPSLEYTCIFKEFKMKIH
jgi:hypothetical protein